MKKNSIARICLISYGMALLIVVAILCWLTFFHWGIGYFWETVLFSEQIFLFALILFGIGTGIALVWLVIRQKQSEYYTAMEGKSIEAYPIAGLPDIKASELLLLTIDDKGLKINLLIENTLLTEIPFAAITDVVSYSEEQIREKKKNMVGHMAAGGLLLGDIGVLIGYIDSKGTTIKKTSIHYLCISYNNSSGMKRLYSFKIDEDMLMSIDNFVTNLRSYAQILAH